MEVLPDSAANGARNSDVVFQSRPTASDRFSDEVAHDHATLAPHTAVIGESHVTRDIPYHEAPKSPIPDEDVRPEAEDEMGHTTSPGGSDSVCEIIGRYGIVEQVGRTSDPKGGVWR